MPRAYNSLEDIRHYHHHQFRGLCPIVRNGYSVRWSAVSAEHLRVFFTAIQSIHVTRETKKNKFVATYLPRYTQGSPTRTPLEMKEHQWVLTAVYAIQTSPLLQNKRDADLFLFEKFLLLELGSNPTHATRFQWRSLTAQTPRWRVLKDARRLPGAQKSLP